MGLSQETELLHTGGSTLGAAQSAEMGREAWDVWPWSKLHQESPVQWRSYALRKNVD